MTETSTATEQVEPRFYTIAEACDVLKVSENTLRKLIDEGQIPTIRVGERLVRIPARAIDEFGQGVA